MLIIANQVLFWFAFFGYITFKAKYLEHQFRMSAAKANQYIGKNHFKVFLSIFDIALKYIGASQKMAGKNTIYGHFRTQLIKDMEYYILYLHHI